MKKKSLMSSLIPAFLLGISLIFGQTLVSGAVIYQETFGNATGTNQMLSQINTDWQVYTGTTGVNQTTNKTVVSGGASAPTGTLTNIGTGQTPLSTTNGLIYLSGSTQALFATTEMSITPSDYSNITFNWYAGNNSVGVTQRLAVCINGSWYVSNTAFTSTAISSGNDFQASAQLESFTFTLSGAQWRDLNFTANSILSASTTARTLDLPSGTITGFGLFVETGTFTGRFDTFSVSATAVPEPPATVLLFVLLASSGTLLLRKRVSA